MQKRPVNHLQAAFLCEKHEMASSINTAFCAFTGRLHGHYKKLSIGNTPITATLARCHHVDIGSSVNTCGGLCAASFH